MPWPWRAHKVPRRRRGPCPPRNSTSAALMQEWFGGLFYLTENAFLSTRRATAAHSIILLKLQNRAGGQIKNQHVSQVMICIYSYFISNYRANLNWGSLSDSVVAHVLWRAALSSVSTQPRCWGNARKHGFAALAAQARTDILNYTAALDESCRLHA